MDELIQSKMREALDVEQPDPGLRSRVMSSLPANERPAGGSNDSRSGEPGDLRGPWRWVAGGIAAALTLSVVGGLVYTRLAGSNLRSQKDGTVAVSGVDFKCRLPVLAGAAGGFISFPDGAVTIDRRVTVSYKGGYSNTYDAQLDRWVPVPRSALSPDGRSYAYLAQITGVPGANTTMSLHTHEIASGKDRVLWEGSANPMGPNTVTWLPGGLYFSVTMLPAGSGALGPSSPAIYVADANQPSTPRRVGPNPPPPPPSPGQYSYSGPDMFNLVGGSAAWGTGNRVQKEAPPASTLDKTSAPAPGTYGPDRILRMDLRDGTVSTWFTVAGTEMVSLVSLDAKGQPILVLYQPPIKTQAPGPIGPPPARMLLLTGPDQTVEITSGTGDFRMASQPSADAHGIWFGSWGSVWLYTTNGGLRQVATIAEGLFPSPSVPPGYPMKGSPASDARFSMPKYMQGTMVAPAGPCA